MSISVKEIDLYPNDLFDLVSEHPDEQRSWWLFYTRAQQDRKLARHLLAKQIPFYAPLIPRRRRMPSGGIRTSFIPLFSNYVFLFGDGSHRYDAMASNCVSRWFQVPDGLRLKNDLLQVRRLIETGRSITPEARLSAGDRVRVLSGPFQGFEGSIIRCNNKTRLLVGVDFMQQGASVELENCQVERIAG